MRGKATKQPPMSLIFLPYVKTFRFVRRQYAYVLLLTTFYWLFQIGSQVAGISFGVKLVIYMTIFYFMLRKMMFGAGGTGPDPRHERPPLRIGRFFLNAGFLFIVVLFLTLAGFLAYDAATGFQSTAETRLFPLFITLMITSSLVVGAFGTILPAAVANDPREVDQRLGSALRAAPRVFVGTVFGPVLMTGLGVFAFALLDGTLAMSTPIQAEDGTLQIGPALLFLPVRFFGVLTGFLAAAVLIEAYRPQAPEGIRAAMSTL